MRTDVSWEDVKRNFFLNIPEGLRGMTGGRESEERETFFLQVSMDRRGVKGSVGGREEGVRMKSDRGRMKRGRILKRGE